MIKQDIEYVKAQLAREAEKDRYSRHLTKSQGEMLGLA